MISYPDAGTPPALPVPRLSMPERRDASADCQRIVRESGTLAEIAAKLQQRFPEHVIHGDHDGVGVYDRLQDFDKANGRLGKIGTCRFFTRAKIA